MNTELIKDLMKDMNEYNIDKLDYEEKGIRIKLEKSNGMIKTKYEQQDVVHTIAVENNYLEAKDDGNIYKDIKAPVVGTIYVSKTPDKPAMVKKGDKVSKGQALCIIEAMKLMNEIECEYDGEIVDILVLNEDMVEYGQPLFRIKCDN